MTKPTGTKYTVVILNEADGSPRLTNNGVHDAIERYDCSVVSVERGPTVELDPKEWG